MKLLCLGDSNTYGFDPASSLGSRYPDSTRWTELIEKWDVINCGMNGLTVPGDSEVWANLIENSRPDLVCVMLGSNDLLELRSAEETVNRMRIFLCGILRTGSPVLLVAPPPLRTGTWVRHDSLIQESLKLCRMYKKLAGQLKIDFADADEWNVELAFDGVHFTEAGHLAFARGLNRHLDEKYERERD